MRKFALLIILIVLAASCGDGGNSRKGQDRDGNQSGAENTTAPDPGTGTESQPIAGQEPPPGDSTGLPSGAVLIAGDIVTEVVIRPDPEGDPWEVEKVAGYNGEALVNSIFSQIYDGSLTVFDYHSGEPLTRDDVKKIEGEFKNDRTKIGKLSFTEDWYWFPDENRLVKMAKSVTFGYELYNNTGKVYAYRAAFRADLN